MYLYTSVFVEKSLCPCAYTVSIVKGEFIFSSELARIICDDAEHHLDLGFGGMLFIMDAAMPINS